MRSTVLLIAAAALGGCNEINLALDSVVEVYEQSPYDQVDVLLVVDDSCSMTPYQEKLGRDFAGFFEFFADGEVDWQIAVTTLDLRSETFGQIRGPLVTPDALDPGALFAEVVNVGTGGGGLEGGLAAAARTLRGGDVRFPREDAGISVVFVSDEEDASPRSIATYVNRYADLRGHRSREAFSASALTVTEIADCDPQQFAASTPGTRYVEAARLTGGISANLCVQDFDQIVLDLALTTSTLIDTFFLGGQPDVATIEVAVDGTPVPCTEGTWGFERVDRDGRATPAIVFAPDRLPDHGAEVVIEYLRGTGDPDDFCPEAG